jgi:hypothetical protein
MQRPEAVGCPGCWAQRRYWELGRPGGRGSLRPNWSRLGRRDVAKRRSDEVLLYRCLVAGRGRCVGTATHPAEPVRTEHSTLGPNAAYIDVQACAGCLRVPKQGANGR